MGPLEVPERPATHDLDFHTHFERRTRLSSLPVYRAEFEKIRALIPGFSPSRSSVLPSTISGRDGFNY